MTAEFTRLLERLAGRLRRYLPLVAVPALAGCVKDELNTRLRSHEENVYVQRMELLEKNLHNDSAPLKWKRAVKLLEERNLVLERSRLRIRDLEQQRDEQWKTWLPSLAASASLATSLSALGSLSFSDIDATLIAPLQIPDPVTERATAFANTLAVVEAKDSYELTYRRQVISLHRLFSQYEALLQQQLDELPVDEKADPSAVLQQLEADAIQQNAFKRIENSLVRLLNLPGQQPRPVPSSRPNMDYQKRIHKLQLGDNYGQLAGRLAAYQIEGALLVEKGVNIERWPSYSMNATAPPLYDNARDEAVGFDSGDISLFGGISKTYRFTGDEARRVRTAEENTEFVRKNLRQQMDQEARDWLRLKKEYLRLCKKRDLSLERLARIREGDMGGSAFANLEKVRSARSGFRSLDQAKEQFEMEIWLWDDEKWN